MNSLGMEIGCEDNGTCCWSDTMFTNCDDDSQDCMSFWETGSRFVWSLSEFVALMWGIYKYLPLSHLRTTQICLSNSLLSFCNVRFVYVFSLYDIFNFLCVHHTVISSTKSTRCTFSFFRSLWRKKDVVLDGLSNHFTSHPHLVNRFLFSFIRNQIESDSCDYKSGANKIFLT